MFGWVNSRRKDLLLQLTRPATQPLEKEVLDGQLAKRFMTLFSSYTKRTARTMPDVGWLWQAKAYLLEGKFNTTIDTFKNHLNGQHPLGIYLLDDDEMVRFVYRHRLVPV